MLTCHVNSQKSQELNRISHNSGLSLVFNCVAHILECKPRQGVCEYKTCLIVLSGILLLKLSIFILNCLLYWTSSDYVNIVISTLKFISIINSVSYFIFSYLFRNCTQKYLGVSNPGFLISTRSNL